MTTPQHSQIDESVPKDGVPALYQSPAIQRPTVATVERISKSLGLDLSDEYLRNYTTCVGNMLEPYDRVYRMIEPKPPVKYPRTPGYRPPPGENRYNAWYMKTDIRGAPSGKLANKTVAIKDSICVAGVPMMNGSKLMEGYTPEFDATVVTRTLDEGGIIKGKAACENMCLSGNSFTNDLGPILNPCDTTRSAGGSSSGSAALVAAGEVDLAIGGDQGGSVRLPSTVCGVVGLKPTWGLVPYTGAAPIELSVDSLGPIARNVTDCALFLEVLAGYDEGRDHRQPSNMTVPEYTKLLTTNLDSVKVGVLTEGFTGADPKVESAVRAAARNLADNTGATVSDVSLPMHLDGRPIWTAIIVEGCQQTMITGAGNGLSVKGFHSTTLTDHLTRAYRTRMNDAQPAFKLIMLTAEYLKETTNGHFYARGSNLAQALTAAYDNLLADYDVIIMPTILDPPQELPRQGVGRPENLQELIQRTLGMVQNTCPFNVTGHPALSINVAPKDQLPIGMMIVGKKWHDADVLKVAYAYECIRDGK